MADRVAELHNRLQEIKHLEEDDIPFGKASMQRDIAIQLAVEAADDVILEVSDGTEAETNLLTAEVALKLLEKTVMPLRAAFLRRELMQRDRVG